MTPQFYGLQPKQILRSYFLKISFIVINGDITNRCGILVCPVSNNNYVRVTNRLKNWKIANDINDIIINFSINNIIDNTIEQLCHKQYGYLIWLQLYAFSVK